MNFAEATSPKDNTADSNKSATSKRFTPKRLASARMNLATLQQQLAEMQNIMRQQQEIISGLTRNNHHHPPPNSIANDVLRQFVKSPTKFFAEVNPRKPQLSQPAKMARMAASKLILDAAIQFKLGCRATE
jgi:hypothetical protein